VTSRSAIYAGTVRHRRFQPKPRQFAYRVFYLMLDLDELPGALDESFFFSARRVAPLQFRRADYIGDPSISLRDAVRNACVTGGAPEPTGPITLLTMLRAWGFLFNPVSFYYCWDRTGERVETIVAEITNTPWGERRALVLPAARGAGYGSRLRFTFPKDFHVSPFLPMEVEYDWTFTTPGRSLVVQMEDRREGELLFDATLTLRREAISPASLRRIFWRHPALPQKATAAIYLHALLLWLRRTPFHTHPVRRGAAHRTGAGAPAFRSPEEVQP
jgi:hypothetical protein